MSHLSVLFKDKTNLEIREAANRVVGLMKEGKIKPSQCSILDIAESTLGREGLDAMRHANENEGFIAVQESVDPVHLAAFNNITGQLVLQGVMEQYRRPELIGESLVTTETSNEDNTRVPGLTPIDDDAMVVNEGEEYPDVKFGEDYIDIPSSTKRGMKIGLTREMIFFDRTGQVMKMASSVGERLGTNKEKRILQVALGITNNFKRKGTARNTYVASADPRINKLASNPLVDWTDIDAVMNLFNAMTDDRASGEPIEVMPDTIIVPRSKLLTARQILTATEVRANGNAAAGTPDLTTVAGNPVNGMFNIVSSPWIEWLLVKSGVSAANAAKYWYLGQPKKAFTYRTLFPLQVRASSANDKDDFDRDVVAQFRADERGVCYVNAPWYMAQSYDA